jgi:hypothetical protein
MRWTLAMAEVALLAGIGLTTTAFAQGQEAADPSASALMFNFDEIAEKVRSETVVETVRNLETSPELIFITPDEVIAGGKPFFQRLEALPRIAKMLDIARNGTPEERQLLKKECLKGCERYLKDIPGYQPTGYQRLDIPTVIGAASAYLPYVLVELEQSREVMALTVRMNERYQAAMRAFDIALDRYRDPAHPEKWRAGLQVRVWAAVCDRVLRGLIQDEHAVGFLSKEQAAVLERYRELERRRQNQQETPEDFLGGHDLEVLAIATEFTDAPVR